MVLTALAAGSGENHMGGLTKGWDIFDRPLDAGIVNWNYDNAQSEISFVFELAGAEPNHKYTVGVHLFNKDDLTQRPSQINDITRKAFDNFPGERKAGNYCITREGNTACVDAFDFGTLTTDETGSGKAVIPPKFIFPGIYYAQFSVRIDDCPVDGGSGCAAVYRSGDKFAQNFAEINI
jgi:hypothetical protein